MHNFFHTERYCTFREDILLRQHLRIFDGRYSCGARSVIRNISFITHLYYESEIEIGAHFISFIILL